MRIGTDVSMDVNIGEGYTIMEYKKRELFKDVKFDPDCSCRFLAHYPAYIRQMEGWFGRKRLILDVDLSANELWDMYSENNKDIDRCMGCPHEFPIDEFGMLILADSVRWYRGLE